MGSIQKEVSVDVPPYLTTYKDGTFQRHFGNEVAPANFDSATGVVSKDVLITPETGVSARLYRPHATPDDRKLPLVVYFHGGAFIISSTADPKYHASLNSLVSAANCILASVDYRRAPEHPLPAAYDDSAAALQWVASHSSGAGEEPWLLHNVDFDRVFLAGDSAGANISHYLLTRVGSDPNPAPTLKIHGVIMIHPYFWSEERIGSEAHDPIRTAMVDGWWRFVCPSEKGNDDPLINPFAEGASGVTGLNCKNVIICVAGNDILRDRGRLYYEKLSKEWSGRVEIVEVEGEDHVFHIIDPNGDKAQNMIKSIASFINDDK